MRARPPEVVSGLPNMTPIFWRIWLMKMMQVLVLRDGRREDAQRLAHEAGLQADVRIADFALRLRPRGTRAATESMTMMSTALDLTSISAIFSASSPLDGLADEQAFQIDAEALGPARIEGVLGVDEGGHAAALLGVGDGVQGDGRLAARFRPEDLDDPAARQPLAAQGDVEAQGAGRNALHVRDRWLSSPSCMMAPLPNCFSICARAFFSSRFCDGFGHDFPSHVR